MKFSKTYPKYDFRLLPAHRKIMFYDVHKNAPSYLITWEGLDKHKLLYVIVSTITWLDSLGFSPDLTHVNSQFNYHLQQIENL